MTTDTQYQYRQISEDEFIEKYKPVLNHFYKDPVNEIAFNGTMFETYGEEDAYIRKMAEEKPNHVWTLAESDQGEYIDNGWHYVNRLGYFITEIPFEDNEEISVLIEQNIDPEAEDDEYYEEDDE